MFFEDQRRDVWQLAHAVDDGELNVWIVFRNLFHDRRLRKTNADDQIEIPFSERAHGGFDGVGSARLDVTQNDRQIACGTLHTFPGSSVERPIVLSTDIKNNADFYLRRIFGSGASGAARERQRYQHDQKQEQFFTVFHLLMISLTNLGGAGGSSPT